jgi:hypothetical protein
LKLISSGIDITQSGQQIKYNTVQNPKACFAEIEKSALKFIDYKGPTVI